MVAACALLCCILFVGTHDRDINIKLHSGCSIRIRRACLFGSIRNKKCTLTLKSGTGLVGNVELLQPFCKAPIIVFPSTNDETFLCVYDNDVDIQLLRINLKKGFRPFSAINILRPLVPFSTCQVDRVMKTDTSDWAFAAATLERMSTEEFRCQSVPSLDLVLFRKYVDQKELAAAMHNCGNQGIYDGEATTVTYPK
jgi:hypothetical protein